LKADPIPDRLLEISGGFGGSVLIDSKLLLLKEEAREK